MWNKFTERARRVVFFAQEEAQKCGQNFVAPEHLLMGLLHEHDSAAHRVLSRLNVEPARLGEELATLSPVEAATSQGEMQLSPRCKLVIDCAYDEARLLKNNFIGTEHLLLGLLREDETTPYVIRLRRRIVGSTKHLALQTLEQHGVTLEAARIEVRKIQGIDELRASSAPHDSDTELRAAQPPSDADSATELRAASPPANEQTPDKGGDMWQRFTERARRVVFFAQEEAGKLGENYVSTEHILLGLVRENDTVATRILDRMGISLGRIRAEIERQVTRGDGRLGQDMQLTPRAKRVIDLAYDEARQLSVNYIGTEHLLLGLIREGEGLAGRVLTKLGAELTAAREMVASLQDKDTGLPVSETPRPSGYRASVPGMDPSEMLEIAQLKLCIEVSESWRKKSLVSLKNVSIDEFKTVLAVAAGLKKYDLKRQPSIFWQYPRTLALVFEKPSLRTRVSFEVAMTHLHGQAIYLAPGDVGLGTREAVPDVAGALSRWVDILAARVFKHETVEELALHATIPVINALSEREHPIQAFADLLTVQEQKGPLGNHLTLGYVGDGNNVLNALLLACAKMGVHVRAGCPEGYGPDAAYVDEARRIGKEDGTGATVTLTADPAEAVRDADVIYTDVWASMGQEAEREERARLFAPYQVNAALVAHARPDAIVLHDLPAHRGEEITDDIMERFKTPIFDQAENRLHTQKALLALIVGL